MPEVKQINTNCVNKSMRDRDKKQYSKAVLEGNAVIIRLFAMGLRQVEVLPDQKNPRIEYIDNRR
jgi:hypothetical protein